MTVDRNELRSRLLVFVVVVALTVTGVATAGVVTDQGTTEKPTVEEAHFQPESVDAPVLERGGDISIDAGTGSKTIVIDVAHSNDVSVEDLQPAVSALTAAGHTVEYYDLDPDARPEKREEGLTDALEGADAYVVVDPGARYLPSEAELVSEFAEADGRVLFLGGPESDDGGSILGAFGLMGPAMDDDGEFASVTSPFGIGYDTGYLYDMENYETNYRTIGVTPPADSDLTEGVDRVVLDGPTQVLTAGDELLTTNPTAEHSESREADEYAVAARNDNAVAIGDTALMTTENYNVADNEVFIGNVLEFLVSGDAATGDLGDDEADADADPDRAPAQGE
ncbi:hypothetical protein SAMN05444422_102201 [Halobiforma haloterrestris]|uniref:GATase domain protein n=1 Tax=Natronobacterium haloterrestre TaxID=148448 RepID=A0A1I1EAJ2_NATHA|nr:hypothetical protein [Halobiforma haloterrestris]SFB82040.1 hypothetical protein SAMN05444422_102201 [Halobiforma haloterrestris]